MELKDIEFLLPNNIVSEYENDTEAFDTMVNATNQIIKYYSGSDYKLEMINEFVDVFLKLCSKHFENLTKEQVNQFEVNYTKAIEKLQSYKASSMIVSGVYSA